MSLKKIIAKYKILKFGLFKNKVLQTFTISLNDFSLHFLNFAARPSNST